MNAEKAKGEKTPAKPKEVKKKEPLMYIGPSIPGEIKSGQILIDGIPKTEIVSSSPIFLELFVKISEATKKSIEFRNGGAVAGYYKAAVELLQKGR